MSEILKEKKFEPTGTILRLESSGILWALFERATYTPEENAEETRWIKENFEASCRDYPNLQFRVIMDLTKPGNAEYVPDEAMKIYRDLLKHSRIQKVATFGQTHWFDFVITLVGRMSKTIGKIRSFTTKEEALAWLRVS